MYGYLPEQNKTVIMTTEELHFVFIVLEYLNVCYTKCL